MLIASFANAWVESKKGIFTYMKYPKIPARIEKISIQSLMNLINFIAKNLHAKILSNLKKITW